MKRYLAGFLLFLLILPGCQTFNVPAPQTPRERLAAAEATYQAAVASVRDNAALITPDQVPSIGSAIKAARTALDAWHINPDLTDSADAALAAIRALQAITTKLAQRASR